MIIQKEEGILGHDKKKLNLGEIKIISKPAVNFFVKVEEYIANKSNLIIRILSALLLGPVFIIAILFNKPLFYLLMFLITIGMLYEWWKMTKSSSYYTFLGFIILPIPTISLTIINSKDDHHWLLLLYFIIIWSVDTFAMVGGKILQGPKLAPKISPNKTWSGLLIGALSSGLSAFLFSLFGDFYLSNMQIIGKKPLIIAAISFALIAQMSDLFVSYFKRKFDIKDSGTIIPGHGGVLDRFDSIILTSPLLYFISKIL